MDTGPEAPERRRRCKACGQHVSQGARFCANCGAFQDRPAERRIRLAHMKQQWIAVKGCILFYVVLLCGHLALIWTPVDVRGTAVLVVSVVDVIIICAYWRLSRARLAGLFRLSNRVAWSAVAGMLLLGPVLALNYGYHRSLLRWFGAEEQKILRIFETEGYGLPVMIIAICVMPAIWEEIAFRGLLQEQFNKAVRTPEAVVVTAILFAVIHLTTLSAFYLFLFGIILGVLRLRSGSLIPGMLVHFAHNLVVVLGERYGF